MSGHSSVITTRSLIADFERLGLHAGQTVLAHTSMKALSGYVVGDAPAVVDALLHVLTPAGTLIMPSHSTNNTDPATWQRPPVPPELWDTVRAEMPPYRPEITPTNRMGTINECFRAYPGVRRSGHPAYSFASWGRHAAFVTADQALNNSVAEASPIGRLYELDGWVLLLGVDYRNNTSLHLAEYRANWEGKQREVNGSAMLQNGRRVWVTYYDDSVAADDFDQLGAAFEAESGLVHIGHVAGATARLMRQRPLVDFAVRWFEANRPGSLRSL
jgi:aminoglycoside 3-N-acetyltransferase